MKGKLGFGVNCISPKRNHSLPHCSSRLHQEAILYASWIEDIFILKYDILAKIFSIQELILKILVGCPEEKVSKLSC